MAKILVIDDEKSIRNALTDILEFEKHQVDAVENGLAGLEKMQAETYDVIFSDIKMPQMDGLELLQRAVEMGVETPIVMISGHGNIETAVESIKKGAYDFIEKPIDLNRLLVVVRNALDKKTLVAETKKLKKKIGKQYEMIGESEPIKHLRAMIERVAPTDARILITGDNGTGKEVVARQIYQLSHRSQMPFVEVNCA
ncbi:MAG TPA: response regulator, partial [Paludibacteraceae bacterium]|nr:response regulator [Paludibacteraceae bacterium]